MKRHSKFATLVVLAFLFLTVRAIAQTTTIPPASSPSSTGQSPTDKHEPDVDFGSREIDARTRLAIKADKKAYEEHVARAKEAKQLAADVKAAYESKHSLSAEDKKKLERLEKLTRRIRNDVGGSETNSEAKDLPASLSEAMISISKMADELCEDVEKTPRQVISATIIDQANKLISVIQLVRDSQR